MNDNLKNQLIEWRHYLHENPESAFEEFNTSYFIAETLKNMGLEVFTGIGKTGVIANLKCGKGEKVIGFRADMDCIKLEEETKLPYASRNSNRMHACGHDGHMTTILGAAKILSETRDFNGTVRFVFQPAEEPGYGAKAMIEDGLFERFPMDEIYGFHNMPQLPQGEIHTKIGGIMASEDNFVIKIHGKGGHASAPDVTIDPLVIGAEIILGLQTIVSRNLNPLDTGVVSCTEFLTDGIHNAIPSNVTIKGDTRSFSPEVQKVIEDRMKKLSVGITENYNGTCEFSYTHEFLPTINTKEQFEITKIAASNVVGEENVNFECKPMMSSEDFAHYLRKIPGCLVFIGGAKSMNAEDIVPLHNSRYDYNDENLELGAKYFAEIARIALK